MGRKTLTIPEEIYEDLDDVNREDESFGDTIARLVDAVEGGELGDGTGEHDPNTLTEDHIPDIAGATARETADILEERLRGR